MQKPMPHKLKILLFAFMLPVILTSPKVVAREPDYGCYMQTSSGGVINLESLCAGRSTVQQSPQTPMNGLVVLRKNGSTSVFIDMDSVEETGFDLVVNRPVDPFVFKVDISCQRAEYSIDGDSKGIPNPGTVAAAGLDLACRKLGYSRYQNGPTGKF